MGAKAKLARGLAVAAQVAVLGPLAALTAPIVDIGLEHCEDWHEKNSKKDDDD